MPQSALEGLKVVDLTHHIAGPYCTKLLADFGADVVKIERAPSGDPARRMGPFFHDQPRPEKSLLFLYLNTSKRGVTLNLKADTGKHILKRLVQDADVLVENFRPRLLPSLGLDYEELREINPHLVMASISNFGQTGPYRDYEATDIVEYALGGLSYVLGSNEREPLKHALHQAQFKAGTNAASAILIAAFHQQITGKGQRIDVSIQECVATGLRDNTALYTYQGAVRQRQPPTIGDMPRGPVQARGGYVVPVAFGDVDWGTIADFLDIPQLKEPRFSTPRDRLQNATELDAILSKTFGGKDRMELFESAHRLKGLIYGIVQSPEEVVGSPQYRARGYFTEIEHPHTGKVTYPGAPFLMSGTPWGARSPAPTLGQHNKEVICDELGYSLKELTQLRASGVI